MYRLHPLDAEKFEENGTFSGAVLTAAGIAPLLTGDYDSTALVLQRVGADEH